jgi:hypothetical protein
MCEKIKIHERKLQELLENDNTVEEALSAYFQIDDTSPFSPSYKLKPDVEVISDTELEGFRLVSLIVGIANGWSRRKRKKQYERIIKQHPNRLRLVSEGDSWFQHPLIKDIIDHLFNHFAIYSLGAGGDELSNMFRENEYLPAIETQNAKGFMLSGGGNDLMGGHFGDYLNNYSTGTDPKRFLNEEFFAKVEDMINIYDVIFKSMKQIMPNVKIFTHGYDYVIPRSGKAGKYLGSPMEKKGITNPDEKMALIRLVIDTFNNRMENLAARYENVIFTDVRGTVREAHWADEIHPDSNGFQQVALKFQNRIIESLM